ncbi:MAG: S-layer homology domain-containing protein, partial [Syntrophomonadaceae bacterium]
MKTRSYLSLLTLYTIILAFLFVMVPQGFAGTQLNDIRGHWAESTIQKMVDQGVVTGMPDGSFKPDNSITRAEFATLVVKAFKLEYRNGKIFSDTAKHWGRDNIATANAHGIVSGYNENYFGPDDPITREQMAVMVVKAAKIQNSNGALSCTDSDKISSWAKEAVTAAYSKKIITGMPDGSFRPQANATRAEAVIVLSKTLQLDTDPIIVTPEPVKVQPTVTISKITIKTKPSNVNYRLGDNLDLSGLVVTLTKSDGTTEDVALADFSTKGITTSIANGAILFETDTQITIKVENQSVNLNIFITAMAGGGGGGGGSGGGGGGGGGPIETVAVTGVSLDKNTLNLSAGGATSTLVATVNPAKATNKNVTWSSSNTNIATVANGVVTPVAAGSATITVKTEDGNFTATCAVTVVSPSIYVTGVSLDKDTLSLTAGGVTGSLVATVTPANATNKNVTWSSSNESVATVADGVV